MAVSSAKVRLSHRARRLRCVWSNWNSESALLGSSALGLGSLSGEGGLSEVRAVDRKFMVDRSASVCSSTSSEEKVTWREVFVFNFCGNLPLCFT